MAGRVFRFRRYRRSTGHRGIQRPERGRRDLVREHPFVGVSLLYRRGWSALLQTGTVRLSDKLVCAAGRDPRRGSDGPSSMQDSLEEVSLRRISSMCGGASTASERERSREEHRKGSSKVPLPESDAPSTNQRRYGCGLRWIETRLAATRAALDAPERRVHPRLTVPGVYLP